jgi:hypothetical protein
MFTNAAQRKVEKNKALNSTANTTIDGEGTSISASEESRLEESKDGEISQQKEGDDEEDVQEKEKILAGVRQYAISMSSDIKDLLKNEWAGTIQSLEGEKKKAENERKENLQKAKNDTNAI